MWDVPRHEELFELGIAYGPSSLSFSPDGETLAAGESSFLLTLWDVSSGRTISALQGHEQRLTGVGFTPNGKTIVTSSHDKTVRLWKAEQRIPDLAFYLASGAYGFDEYNETLTPNLEVTFDSVNVGPWTCVGATASAKSPEEYNRMLFDYYRKNLVWSAAALLLDKPMDLLIPNDIREEVLEQNAVVKSLRTKP